MENKPVKKLESFWKEFVFYPFLRLFIKNIQLDGPVNTGKIKKILIVRNDRIGDMIVTTPVYKGLKEQLPGVFIGVLASKNNYEIIRNNPHIDKIHIMPSGFLKIIREVRNIRNEGYDLLLNFVFLKMTLNGILANFMAPKAVKIGQGESKYRFYYNRLLSVKRHTNYMVEVLFDFVKESMNIDLQRSDNHYDICMDEDVKAKVMSFTDKNGLGRRQSPQKSGIPYVVFNISVGDSRRKLSIEQASALGELLGSFNNFRTIIIHMSDDSSMLTVKESLIKNPNCVAFPEKGNANLLDISCLIEGAWAVVTVDTSIIHFASASKTPVLGIYGELFPEWLPYKVLNSTVSAGKDLPVSSIPGKLIIETARKFISDLKIANTGKDEK